MEHQTLVTIERLPYGSLHLYRAVFYCANDKPTMAVDASCIGELLVAIADRYGYELHDVANRYGQSED